MRKCIVVGCILGFLIIMLPLMALGKTQEKVDVMFIHDTHSHLNPFTTVDEGETKVLGGFSRIHRIIKDQKEKNEDTLLLDAGDFSMGTLIQVVYEEEASELRMLGALGFDATTLGNHEFDYRSKGLAHMLDRAVDSGEELPELVLCNVDWESMNEVGYTDEQQMLADAFANYGVEDYVVFTKNDVHIAVLGVFGKDCMECVPNCPLKFKDPVEAVRETVARIKETENVDMIVCVSHSGTWEDETKSEDEILAKEVPELDLIISGHTHTKLDKPIQHGDTYIVSAGNYGKNVGSLSMERTENGRWNMTSYQLIETDEAVEQDMDTQYKIDEMMNKVDELYLAQFGLKKDDVLCTNDIEFGDSQNLSMNHGEENLGNIMADAYTYAVEQVMGEGTVDVAVVPSGTVRDTYPLGNITTENVFHSFSLGIGADGIPGYPLVSAYLTGEELRTVAEVDASISDLMTEARLYTDGLYWTYNPNRFILNKISDVYLSDAQNERVELKEDQLYHVVTDYYTSQMLGRVTDLSYGLLSIVPKDAQGQPIEDFENAIIYKEDSELKAWVAIAEYMKSFEDTDGDGVGNIPARYGSLEGRKVVDERKDFQSLYGNSNPLFFKIIGWAMLFLITLVSGICFVYKKIKK